MTTSKTPDFIELESIKIERASRIKPYRSLVYDAATSTWVIDEIGSVIGDTYEDSKLRQYWFMPKGTEDRTKAYSLGTSPTGRAPGDHTDILWPIVEAGWKTELVVQKRAGAQMFAVFSHPTIALEDLITWDRDLFPDQTTSLMKLSLGVYFYPRMGHVSRAVGGFFRVICQNGLISQTLNLLNQPLNRGEIEFGSLVSKLESGLERWKSQQHVVFSGEEIDMTRRLLGRYSEDDDAMPANLQEALAPLSRYTRKATIQQLSYLLDGKEGWTKLDVLNAVTDLISTDQLNPTTYFKMDALLSALINVMVTMKYLKSI